MNNPTSATLALDQGIVGDGVWFHFDARPVETAVSHPPAWHCPVVGRHPIGDCGLKDGPWNPRYERDPARQIFP